LAGDAAKDSFEWRSVSGATCRRLLDVADFLFDLAGYLFTGTAISQVGIADGSSALLFHFAFGFLQGASDFVFVLDVMNRNGCHEQLWADCLV